jgi:HNH endonuclease
MSIKSMTWAFDWEPRSQICGANKVKEAIIAAELTEDQFHRFVEALYSIKKPKPSPFVENPTEGPIKLSRDLRDSIMIRDDHKCKHCGSKQNLCIDHVFPLSRGGKSTARNLQVLYRPCNSAKGNKI